MTVNMIGDMEPPPRRSATPHVWFSEINKAWQHSLVITIGTRDGKTYRGNIENNPDQYDVKVSIKDYAVAQHHRTSNVILISEITRIQGDFPR